MDALLPHEMAEKAEAREFARPHCPFYLCLP